ncbi:putative alpha helix protein [Klebsiella aerogenes]|nr:putative alpha helix protein [Klebsiella aerogenes]
MLKLPLRSAATWWRVSIPSARKSAVQVRPLYQLWRDGQTRQLQLVEERARYAKLQQSSDSELETLRQQELALREQLELTTRKLENLTDIERQLSSRSRAVILAAKKCRR